MKSFMHKKQRLIIILGLALVLVFSTIYFTLAYHNDSTTEYVNKFEEKEIEVDIDEDFTGAIKENVKIKNIGEVPAYMRFKLSVSVVDKEDNIIALPIHSFTDADDVATSEYRAIQFTDFTISNHDASDWASRFTVIDDIYYYPQLVGVNENISVFDKAEFNIPILDIETMELPNLSKKTHMSSAYIPVLSIVVESVQAEGVTDAWGVTYETDGEGNTTVAKTKMK